MVRVAVVYFSQTGITQKLARAVIEAAKSEDNVVVVEHQILGAEIIEGRFVNAALFNQLESCDAIIFGTPTYMGNISAQFKAFADATSELWCEQLWSGKVAAGFTSGSALNGDQTNTLQYMVTLSNQHGMYWVGLDSALGYEDKGINRLGCQLGVVSQSSNNLLCEVHKTDVKTAKYLSKRVVKLAKRLQLNG